MAKHYQLKLAEKDLTQFTFENHPAVSFQGEGSYSAMGKVNIHCKIYLLDTDVIQVTTFVQKGQEGMFEFERFFSSLKLLDDKPQPGQQ